MKTERLFWGLGFILAALFIVLDSMGITERITGAVGGISVFALIIGVFFTAFAISRLVKGKISEAVFPFAFAFMAFEENIAYILKLDNKNIINNGTLAIVALLLTVGLEIIFPEKGILGASKGGRIYKTKKKTNENSLGSGVVYVDCESMTPSHFENSLGSCVIHFMNVEKFKSGSYITIENDLGSTVVNVPSAWYANVEEENNLGSVSVQRREHFGEPVLNIRIENCLGSVSVKYV